jgi:hypothetical protein
MRKLIVIVIGLALPLSAGDSSRPTELLGALGGAIHE